MKEVKTYELQLTEDQKDKLEKLLDVIDVNPATIKEIDISEDGFPKQGDNYYFINSCGEICSDIKMSNDIRVGREAIIRKRIGNIFKTIEDVNFTVEKLKVIAEMRKFAEPMNLYKWNGINGHYYITYPIKGDSLSITRGFSYIESMFYFDSEETARKCIDEVGEDRIKKYYIGIV